VVTCPTTSARPGERSVRLRCEIRAQPDLSALFWITDINGTTVAEGTTIDDIWSASVVSLSSSFVPVWLAGNGVGHINEVTLRRARLVLGWVIAIAGTPSWYATSHSSQLSLLSSAIRKMCTGQEAVAVLCGWEGNLR